jgi:hypothetical protein
MVMKWIKMKYAWYTSNETAHKGAAQELLLRIMPDMQCI